jgi:hypothetical protein
MDGAFLRRQTGGETMGFFSKKNCDICGGEIGLLGNRKLADGNLCKNCARKLSPWMTDRRESTVEEIRQHLMYRAQNQRVLAGVHPTAVVGADTKVYIDEPGKRFFVTPLANWRDGNPDVISFSQVVDVQTEVTEHRTEEYHRDREGHQVSFNPPRYRYSYEFVTTIHVDSPWFNRIRFELTGERPERIGSDEYRYYEQQANALRAVLMGAPNTQSAAQEAQQAVCLAILLAVLGDLLQQRFCLCLNDGKLKEHGCVYHRIGILLEWEYPFVLSCTHRRPTAYGLLC